MKTVIAGITQPGLPPPREAQLVVFTGSSSQDILSRDSAEFLAQAAAYASNHGVYLVPGLYLQGSQLCVCLLDDHGKRILEQASTHLNRAWAAGLQRGDEVKVIETPFAKIALCVDVDIYKGEVPRIAALQGAEIVVSCQYIRPAEDGREMILAGAWQQAQQNCLYLLNSNNLNASIIGPCETAPDRTGFLVDISSSTPMRAELSAEKRAAAYRSFPIFASLNPGLYQRHSEELWK